MNNFLISVIVPTFNEEKTIGKVLNKLVGLSVGKRQIVVVDDGSTDGTKSVVGKFVKTKENKLLVKYIEHNKNMGKGAAIRTAISQSSGKWIAIQDADLEYEPSNIVNMVNLAEKNGAMVVYGNRNGTIKNRYLYPHYYWGAKILYGWINWLYGLKLSDPETCQKLIRRDLIDFEIDEKGFGVEVELTAKLARKGIKILEMPITYNPRSFTEGKKIRIRDGLRAVWVAWKYWW